MKKIISLSLFLIIIDQIVKSLVDSLITLNKSINIIPNFFSITYVRNIGAAFSIFKGQTFFFILTAIIAIIFIIKYLKKKEKISKLNIVIYSFLISGIFGNLIDRIFRGYVIDYLDFKIFKYDAPIFNIADILIVISCIMLVIFGDDFNGVNSKK